MRDGELRMSWASSEGTPSPLGVAWVEEEHAYNFALYSAYACGVTLQLYAEDDLMTPLFQYDLNYLRNKSGRMALQRARKRRRRRILPGR
jgi:isoamylase